MLVKGRLDSDWTLCRGNLSCKQFLSCKSYFPIGFQQSFVYNVNTKTLRHGLWRVDLTVTGHCTGAFFTLIHSWYYPHTSLAQKLFCYFFILLLCLRWNAENTLWTSGSQWEKKLVFSCHQIYLLLKILFGIKIFSIPEINLSHLKPTFSLSL